VIEGDDQTDALAAPADLEGRTGSEPDGGPGVGRESEAATGLVRADRPGPSGGGRFAAEVGELTEGGGRSGIRHAHRFDTAAGEQRLGYRCTRMLVV
jgi:hypothetical protein